jgi:hypothetical protein
MIYSTLRVIKMCSNRLTHTRIHNFHNQIFFKLICYFYDGPWASARGEEKGRNTRIVGENEKEVVISVAKREVQI